MTLSRRWIRTVCWALLIVACVFGLLSLLTWLAQGRPPSAGLPVVESVGPGEVHTVLYRLDKLEQSMVRIEGNSDRTMWLLLANLAGVTGSLFTYIVTNRRRFFD